MFSRKFSRSSLVAALSMVLFGACGGKGGAGASTEAGGPLSYVPAGSNVVAVIEVKKLLDAPAMKDGIEQAKAIAAGERDFKQLQELTGIDPFKDVATVVIGGSTDDKDGPAIVLVGSFDAKKVADAVKAKEPKMQAEAVSGNTLLLSPSADAFAKAKEASKGAALAGSPDLKALYDLTDKSHAITFAVKVGGRIEKDMNGPLAGAQAVFGSMTVTDGMAMKGAVRFSAADKANGLKTELEGQLGQVKPMAAMMGLSDMLDGLKLSVSGNDFVGEFSLSAAQIKKAQDTAKGMLGGGMGGGQPPMPMPGGVPGGVPGEMPVPPAPPAP